MNSGQITKSKTTERFTVVPNLALQDSEMSLKAKGLLAYLLSLPSDWVIYKSELHKNFTDGSTSVQTAFKELQDKGYVLSVEIRDECGKFKGYNHNVYDYPVTENPISGNPTSEKTTSDNQVLQKTHSTKTHSRKKERKKVKKENHTSVNIDQKKEGQETEHIGTKKNIRGLVENLPGLHESVFETLVIWLCENQPGVKRVQLEAIWRKIKDYPLNVQIKVLNDAIAGGYRGLYPEKYNQEPTLSNSTSTKRHKFVYKIDGYTSRHSDPVMFNRDKRNFADHIEIIKQ